MKNWKHTQKIGVFQDSSHIQVHAGIERDGNLVFFKGDPTQVQDSDVYFSISVDWKDKLVLSLLDNLYGERQSCASGFEDLMQRHHVFCERHGDWKESRTIVGAEGSAVRQVVAYVDKQGGVGLQVHDLGGPRGREDYEFHVRVPVEQKDLAILALMSEIYLEHASCLKEFEELMEKNAIPIDQIN